MTETKTEQQRIIFGGDGKPYPSKGLLKGEIAKRLKHLLIKTPEQQMIYIQRILQRIEDTKRAACLARDQTPQEMFESFLEFKTFADFLRSRVEAYSKQDKIP